MQLEPLAWGHGLLEGPRMDPEGGVYFSDVTRGGIYRRRPDGEIETILPGQKGVGGIALHAEGGIVITGTGVFHLRNGQRRVLLRVDGVRGFNDLFPDPDGRVYAGSLRSHPFKPGPRVPGELYRVEAEGKATELYGGVGLSNGIGLSPDGATLYHSDSAQQVVLAHDLTPEGGVTNRRICVRTEAGFPDGLAVDEEGCLWVAVYGGGCVARYRPDGRLDGRIPVPARAVTSLCFGGPDRRDLIIATADHSEEPERGGCLYRTRVETPGLEVPLVRI